MGIIGYCLCFRDSNACGRELQSSLTLPAYQQQQTACCSFPISANSSRLISAGQEIELQAPDEFLGLSGRHNVGIKRIIPDVEMSVQVSLERRNGMRELMKLAYSMALCCILAASAWQAVQIADRLTYEVGQERRQFEIRPIAEAVAQTIER